MVSWVEATKSCATKSSSWVDAPVMPRPPRRCGRYRSLRVALDVAAVGDGDHHLLLGDHVLDVDVHVDVEDLRAALVAVELLLLLQLGDDHRDQDRVAGQDLLQVGDERGGLLDLRLQLVALQAGQLGQAHVEDLLRLDGRQVEALHQAGLGGLGVLRRADEVDDRVDVVERDLEALEDVHVGLGLGQVELRAPGDHVAPVLDEVLQGVLERQRLRPAVDDGQHVDAERLLQRRHLPQVVLHDLGHGVLLEVDDHAHALAVGLVAHVGDAVDLLLAHQLGDLLDQPGLVDLVGDLGGDDGLAPALGVLLDLGARPHEQAAAAGAVGLADAAAAADEAAVGKSGPGTSSSSSSTVMSGLLDDGDGRVDDLAQVVRRDVGRHADRDAGRAVDQQVRQPRGQDRRLGLLVVVVGLEVDRLLVDVGQQLLADLLHAALGVAVGRRRIAVDRAEVALPVDERVAHGEVLRQAHQGVVAGGVAVRVELAEHVADHAGALDVRPVPHVVHQVLA